MGFEMINCPVNGRVRINEPFGNNFRSRTASFKANRTNRDPFPLFRAKYRSCNTFLPELQHSIVGTNTFISRHAGETVQRGSSLERLND